MQGISQHDPSKPIVGPDWQETMAWYAKLPQIGRKEGPVDAWREVDAMQAASDAKKVDGILALSDN